MGKLKIWTVGHGTRPVEELASILGGARIELLIDVRAHPGSRRHPQFNRGPLEQALAVHRIAYRWEGVALGGFRKPRPDSANVALRNGSFRGYADHMGSGEFTTAASGLIESARGARLALMCAEQHPSQCHRRLISDWLVSHDVEVEHLLKEGLGELHTLTKGAVVTSGALIYPEAGQLPLIG
jgi:uncharacterized protein (DUF488 family)